MTDHKNEPKHEPPKHEPAPPPRPAPAPTHVSGAAHQPPVDEPPGKYGHQGRPQGVEDPPVPDYAPGTNPPGTNPPVPAPNDPATTPIPGSLPADAPERHGGSPTQDELEHKNVPPSEPPSDQVRPRDKHDKK